MSGASGAALGVIADIHGNLPALEAVLAELGRRGVTRIANLGDCVSGPLWPRETAELLMARGFPTVRGNHDRLVGTGDLSEVSGIDAFAHARLTDAQRAWLGALPMTLTLGDAFLFHARPDNDLPYLLEEIIGERLLPAPAALIERRLAGVSHKFMCCGHSHLPNIQRLASGAIVLNPGSVGFPAYVDVNPPHVSESGTPHARFAIVTGDAIELVALDYDHAAAARRASQNDRADWAHFLTTGRAVRS